MDASLPCFLLFPFAEVCALAEKSPVRLLSLSRTLSLPFDEKQGQRQEYFNTRGLLSGRQAFNYTSQAHCDGPVPGFLSSDVAKGQGWGEVTPSQLQKHCNSKHFQSVLERGENIHARKEFKCLSAASCNLLAWASIYTSAASYLSPWTLQETRGDKTWHLGRLNGCCRRNFLSWVVSAFHSIAVRGLLLYTAWFQTIQTTGKHSALMVMNSVSLCDIIIHYTVMIYYFPPV